MKPAEWAYNMVLHCGLPLAIIANYISFRGRNPDRNTTGKFFPSPPRTDFPDPKIWLHGASVGEMKLVRILRNWACEEWGREEIVVTSGTASGLDSITHERKFLLPADYPALWSRYLDSDRLFPIFIVETEIWPNLYRLFSGRIHLFNAHIKPDSFARYIRFKSLLTETLSHVNTILARNEEDARRFRLLKNSTRTDVPVAGDMKWIPLAKEPEEPTLNGPCFTGERPVFVAGSTWEGEEEPVIESTIRHDLHTYLAPRHMDRLEQVKNHLNRAPLDWVCWSNSQGPTDANVILVDQIGFLADLYARADFCFVGGSWIEGVGGHDLLEPARFGIPIFIGPHHKNVAKTAETLEREESLRILKNNSDWDKAIKEILGRNHESDARMVRSIRQYAQTIRECYRERFFRIVRGDMNEKN